jgi:hypothetical protein
MPPLFMGKILDLSSALVVALGSSSLTSTDTMCPLILMVISIMFSSCSDLSFAKSEQEVGSGIEVIRSAYLSV